MFLRVVLYVVHWEKQILRYLPSNLRVLSAQVLVHTAQFDKAQLLWRPKDQSEFKVMPGKWKITNEGRGAHVEIWGWGRAEEVARGWWQRTNHRGSCPESLSHTAATHPILTFQGWERCVSSLPHEPGAEGKVLVPTAGHPFCFQWQHRARILCHLMRWQHQAGPQDKCPQCTRIASQRVMEHRVVSCTARENTWVTCCLLKYLYSDSECRICYSPFLHIKVI